MRASTTFTASIACAGLLALLPAASRALPIIDEIIEGAEDIANEGFDGIGAIPGLAWDAGRFYLSGPYGIVPALVEGKVVGELTKGLIKNRNPTPEEYAFAQGVFGDTLPPRDHIYITNLSGLEGRAFTSPDKILGGHYMLNLGVDVKGADGTMSASPECPDEPVKCRTNSYPAAGQLYIHEMAHVWQLYQASFQAAQAYKAIYTQIVEGKGAYPYTCGLNWDGYNPEQQASIADTWFGERTACEYRYVAENLRKSRLTSKQSVSGGTAASVSRTPHDMQVWWIPWNGSVQSARWYDRGNGTAKWEIFELAPPGQAAAGGAISAVSRSPELLEIWWIGADRSVQGAWCRLTARAICNDKSQWRQYALAPPGNASQDGSIAAVS